MIISITRTINYLIETLVSGMEKFSLQVVVQMIISFPENMNRKKSCSLTHTWRDTGL